MSHCEHAKIPIQKKLLQAVGSNAETLSAGDENTKEICSCNTVTQATLGRLC